MHMPARVAAAAIIGVLLIGGAVYLFSPSTRSSIGVPGPSPTAVPTPSLAPSDTPAAVATPTRTWGDWQATSGAAIPGLFGANEHIQLSIDWQDGLHTWIQNTVPDLVLRSTSQAAPAGEIRLVSTSETQALGCTEGQVGNYRWSRSADGMFLTLTTVDNSCSNRAAAMSRTWAHSLTAVTDGGLGVIPFENMWLQATVPDQRFGLSGDVDYVDLRAIDGPDQGFIAIKDPFGLDAPCSATRQPLRVLDTTDHFVSYVRTLPGFTATTASTTVAGLPAVHVTMTPRGSAPCLSDGTIVAFHSRFTTQSVGEFALSAGQPHSLWIVAGPKDTYLFAYAGDAVTADQETSVISSLQLLDTLPTP